MENKYADSVWYHFEDEVYENKDRLKGYDLDMDKLEEFKEFVKDGRNIDPMLDASGLLENYKDIDDAYNELDKLVDVMWQGADAAQDKLMKGEFICW